MKSFKIYCSLIIAILMLTLTLGSCSLFRPSQVKQAEKAEKEKIKESEKAYLQLKEGHNDRQTLKTQERMSNTKLRSEYYNANKRHPNFFQRLFGRKKAKNKNKKPKFPKR